LFSPAIARSLFTDALTEAATEAFEKAAAGGTYVSLPPKIASPFAPKITSPTAVAAAATAAAAAAVFSAAVFAAAVPSFLSPPAASVLTSRPFPLSDPGLILLQTAPTDKEMTSGIETHNFIYTPG